MKVLQVNKTDLVGGIFDGYELNKELRKCGIDAKQIVLHKSSRDETVIELEKDIILHQQLCEYEKQHSINNVLMPYAKNLINRKEYQEADVIHYHIIQNRMISILDYPLLMNNKKSIWTIHDFWMLTGNCIHPLECNKWKTICMECSKLDEYDYEMQRDNTTFMWNLKKQMLEQINPHIVVSTSFVENYVKTSPLTKHFTNIYKIPFGVDIKKYDAISEHESRKKLQVDNQDIVIGFRAETSSIKGCSYIYEVLRRLENTNKITILCVGPGQIPADIKQKFRVIELGWLNEEYQVIEFLKACDIFMMPSLAETFGMMAIEAMAAKCAVVCFKDTVVEEIVNAPKIGLAAEYKSVDSLFEQLLLLIYDKVNLEKHKECGYNWVGEKYKFEDYVQRHKELYEQVFASS